MSYQDQEISQMPNNNETHMLITILLRWILDCLSFVNADFVSSWGKVEAMEEFLNQWDIASSDGMVSYDEFLATFA